MKHNFIPIKAGSGLIANYIASFSPCGWNHQWKGNTSIAVGLHIPAKACITPIFKKWDRVHGLDWSGSR